MDVSGSKALSEVQIILSQLQTELLLAGANHRIYDSLMHLNLLENGTFQMFPTVHDAILFSESKLNT